MVILSAAFIIGSFSVASGIRNRNQPQTNQITITGSAEQAVTSNTFQWMASVASTQPTTSAALAQLNGWTAQIRNALIAAGSLNDEISFGTANVQPNTQATGQVTSFTMSETVTVQSSRLTAMQRVLGVSNLLLTNNVPFIAQQPQYTFNGLKKLRPALTAEAAANARQRAQAALGKQVKLGKPISITVGQSITAAEISTPARFPRSSRWWFTPPTQLSKWSSPSHDEPVRVGRFFEQIVKVMTTC